MSKTREQALYSAKFIIDRVNAGHKITHIALATTKPHRIKEYLRLVKLQIQAYLPPEMHNSFDVDFASNEYPPGRPNVQEIIAEEVKW